MIHSVQVIFPNAERISMTFVFISLSQYYVESYFVAVTATGFVVCRIGSINVNINCHRFSVRY